MFFILIDVISDKFQLLYAYVKNIMRNLISQKHVFIHLFIIIYMYNVMCMNVIFFNVITYCCCYVLFYFLLLFLMNYILR
jgi:hypothetical protein